MEQTSESRTASGIVVGVALVFLIGIILALGSNGALAAPGGAGSHIAIVR